MWPIANYCPTLCGVSLEEFHRIFHVETAKKAWDILQMTYEGTKGVNDTKLQILTTCFEELKMGEDESFDSFYSKLNEIVTSKLNLGQRIPNEKIVRKVLRSLPEVFRPKVVAIEESKDIDQIKIHELIGSLQPYKMGLPSHKSKKSIALKSIKELKCSNPEESDIEKEVAYLAKSIKKFLKFKKNSRRQDDKSFRRSFDSRGEFQKDDEREKDYKCKKSSEGSSNPITTCYECNGVSHLKSVPIT